MKGAKELADAYRNLAIGAGPVGAARSLETAAMLDRLAAIDSAVPGEVEEIRTRAEARTWAVGQQVIDIETLLALVQRQAGEFAEYRRHAEADTATLNDARIAARAEVERLKSERSSLAAENARLVNEHAAAMSRADVLAEGVRHWRLSTRHGCATVATQEWEREHGHMVNK